MFVQLFAAVSVVAAGKHEDITVVDLCDSSCAAINRTLNFPAITSTPTYSWNVTATLPRDITAPIYDVVVAFQENLPRPFHYQIPLGHDTGIACGAVKVAFGVSSKGDRSPLPCPGCHVALTFPPCSSEWKAGSTLFIGGQFKMGFFLIPGYEPTPNITVNVTVRGNEGRVIDLTSHQRPKRDSQKRTMHESITVMDLCNTDATGPCTATDRKLNFPIITFSPTYSWNVTASLLADVTTPTYEVAVQLKGILPLPSALSPPMGVDSGSACGPVKVPFGIGAKGNKSPWPCPNCHVAITFPPCSSGWKAGVPVLLKGEFRMGWFLREILTVPNITVNITVRDNGRRVFDLTSHQHPSRGPVKLIV